MVKFDQNQYSIKPKYTQVVYLAINELTFYLFGRKTHDQIRDMFFNYDGDVSDKQ
jgi:hypothetical protein